MRRCVRALAGLMALVALGGVTASAHDMWIEPTTFVPDPGENVGARLRVGQDFVGDPLPRDPALINQFVVDGPGGRKPVPGRTGGDPAGLLRFAAPGFFVVGYRSNPSVVEETAEKFAQFLKEEGLEAVAEQRARRGETGGVRERFSRSAKALLLSGSPSATEGDRSLGFLLELVAERNPYLMKAGDELPVRLTYEDRALAGTLVVAMNRAAPWEKISSRSDKDGRVRLRLSRGGIWLVKAVHLVPAPASSGAEWESIWASLTFDLPAAGGPGATAPIR
jgi:uncharacterized GH25 family protein